MTSVFNSCRKYREELCAVISGDLPAGDRVRLENHLEACVDCQRYRDEIGTVTALLALGVELFPLEPRETTQMRWTSEFEAAVQPVHSSVTRIFYGFLDWSRDMIWPCRRIWAGMAAIWLVVLSLNAWPGTKQGTRGSYPPSRQIIRALLIREGFLSATGPGRETKPPGPSSTKTRSERQPPLQGERARSGVYYAARGFNALRKDAEASHEPEIELEGTASSPLPSHTTPTSSGQASEREKPSA